MLAMKIIDPVRTEWALPIVFVAKKNGSLRICVDCRIVSAVTTCDSYRIPIVGKCIKPPENEKIFFITYANNSY